jgi:hypothetical protein
MNKEHDGVLSRQCYEEVGEAGEDLGEDVIFTKILKRCKRRLIFSVCLKVERLERLERVFFKFIHRVLFFCREATPGEGRKHPLHPLHPLQAPLLSKHDIILRMHTTSKEHIILHQPWRA